MADINVAAISPILNKIILPEIQTYFSKTSVFFNQIKKNVGTTIANNYVYLAARNGMHSGFYAVAEGTQPLTGKGSYIQPYAPLKFVFLTFNFSDQALSLAAAQGKQAISSTFSTELETGTFTARKHMNRIMHGAGTGILCLANGGTAGSTTLTVDGCPAEPSAGNHTKYLTAGQYITIGTTDAQIASVDSKTQVTLAASVAWSDNDVVKLRSADEPMGLAGHIDDGDNVSTYQALARANYPYLNAQTDDVAEALTEEKMIDVYTAAKEFGDGPTVALMGKTMWSKYGKILLSMKRNTDVKPVLNGGWKGLEFMDGIPVILDHDCWEGYVQMPNLKHFTIAEASDMFEWMKAYENGGVLRRSPTDRSAWEGTQKWYMQLMGLQVNDMARLSKKTA